MRPNKNKTNIKLKEDIAKCKESLKSRFIKLGGRNYGIYQSKEIDKFLKSAFDIVKLDSFGEFVLSDDSVPLCVVAIGSYALGEMSVKSSIDLAIIYKNELYYTIMLNSLRNSSSEIILIPSSLAFLFLS